MRTLIISDIHLGSTASRIQNVKRLIESSDFDRLIILGDLFDDEYLEKLSKEEWNLITFIKAIRQEKKAQVIWIEGNHDRMLVDKIPELIDAEVQKEFIWEEGGKRFLAIHGDDFDGLLTDSPIVDYTLGPVHKAIRFFDPMNNHVARLVEIAYSSLSGMTTMVAKKATRHGYSRQADHVFCGHTHFATNKTHYHGDRQVHYHNIGSWTQALQTYAIVDDTGKIEIGKFK